MSYLIRPGSASRDTTSTIRQFPQRDEATVASIEDMNTPGWSNTQDAAKTVTETESKVVAPQTVEDKSVKPPRKTAARKKA